MFLKTSRSTWDLKRTVRIATLLVVASTTRVIWAGTVSDLPTGTRSAGYELKSTHGVTRGSDLRVTEQTYGVGTVALVLGRLTFEPGAFAGSSSASRALVPVDEAGRNAQKLTATVGGDQVLEAEILNRLDPKLAGLLNLPGAARMGNLDQVTANFGGRSLARVRGGVQGALLTNCKNLPEPASIILLGLSLAVLGAARVVRPTSDAAPSRRGRAPIIR